MDRLYFIIQFLFAIIAATFDKVEVVFDVDILISAKMLIFTLFHTLLYQHL